MGFYFGHYRRPVILDHDSRNDLGKRTYRGTWYLYVWIIVHDWFIHYLVAWTCHGGFAYITCI